MKIFTFSFKSLLIAAGLMLGSANAWGGTHYILNENYNTQPNVWSKAVDGVTYTLYGGSTTDYFVYQTGRGSGHNAIWYKPSRDWSSDIDDYVIEFDFQTSVSASYLTQEIAMYDDNATVSGRMDTNGFLTTTTNTDNCLFFAKSTAVADGVTTYTIDGKDKTFTMAAGTWYHFSLSINKTSKEVSYTITADGKDNQTGSYTSGSTTGIATGVFIRSPRSGNISFDNFVMTNETAAEAVSAPNINAPVYAGDNRTVTITPGASTESNPVTTYYTLDGTDPTNESTVYTSALTITSNCTIKAITISSTGVESSIASSDITVGKLTLVTPTISLRELTKSGDYYYVIANVISDNSALLGKPSVTYHATLNGNAIAVTDNKVTFTEAGTLQVYVTADNYTTSATASFTGKVYEQVLSLDLDNTTVTEALGYTTPDGNGSYFDKDMDYYTLQSNVTDYLDGGFAEYNLYGGYGIYHGTEASGVGNVDLKFKSAVVTSDDIAHFVLGRFSGTNAWTASNTTHWTFATTNIRQTNSRMFLNLIELYSPLPENVSATISEAGWATFSSEYALDLANLPDGLTAYYIASDGVSEKYVTLTAASVAVEANTGLLFQGTPSVTYYVPVAASGSPLSGNRLIATDGNDVAAGNYVFAFEKLNPTTTAGFYPLGAATHIDAGKAYLNTGVLSKVLRIGDGEASEVVAPEVVETEEPEILFNMAGVQVDKNFKGFVVNQKGEKRFNR